MFDEDVDIYFARQQVAERLAQAGESLPEGVEPQMGPVSTGLGEVLMWSVDYRAERHRRNPRRSPAGPASSPTAPTSRRKASG